MLIEKINNKNRKAINDFIMKHWYTTKMIIRGNEIDMTTVEGVVAFEEDEIIGLVTYMLCDDTMEITSLDSMCENQGLGTTLLNHAVSIAKKNRL